MKKIALLVTATLLVIHSVCANPHHTKADPTSSAKAEVTIKTGTSEDHAPIYTIKKMDAKIKGADILATLSKDYEGKVVLFDFWATWCGPCRAAMKQLDTLKPELQKKGVAFVYVTGETSPLKNWEPMIKNISGDHYRLTNAQWSDLCGQLNIPGIPAYLLLNKDGSVAYSNLSTGGYPGNDILQNNIEVALTK